MTASSPPKNPDRAPERDYLLRHRANCIADACWGLYNAYEGQAEPRRWLTLAPKAPVKSKGGGTKGMMMVEGGDGTMSLGQTSVPTVKSGRPGYLDIRVPELEPLYIEAHSISLMRTDYRQALAVMPAAWAREWERMEREPARTSLFRFVKNPRMRSASLHPHHYTSDPLMCAGLFLAELCSNHGLDVDEHSDEL